MKFRGILVSVIIILALTSVCYFYLDSNAKNNYIEKTWGIVMPTSAKLIRFEKEFNNFDGGGHCYAVFDVANALKEFSLILKQYKFKRNYLDKLTFEQIYANGSKGFITFEDNKADGLDLGLKDGYYYDKVFRPNDQRIVVYNVKTKLVYFVYRRP